MNLADETHQRNLKDFLLLYNKLTEQCFNHCVGNFNNKKISGKEYECIDVCTDRYVGFNQRIMHNFVEYQGLRQEAAVKEAERKAAEAANSQ
ncbi:mitochondrial import inner membrane translocase subunit Tim9-like [Gigantopelta aegis]|uniref:mitochondrial import inner membrane translocase subunit Tim9-like n=1 Tax=Gigantopelta aegis TaxID=1735272 RepID=UPI001B889CF7|nr:mitochondrial import inner membrane translocase subunit Tim9-like [Gigantopelta aegis]